MNTKSIICGAGEIGQSLFAVLKEKYEETYIRDIENLEVGDVDVLHICFPYSKKFVEYVKGYQKQYNPKYTVIHSTTPVGTTTKCNAYHSPVRGIHPHLERSLKTFIKYLAPKSPELKEYFEDVGIRIRMVNKPETTEAAKLWCTTQYGMNIILEKEIQKYCKDNDVDFNIVYTDCNSSYNEGYEKLGFGKFRKYTIDHVEGEIGGHCVKENAHILNSPSAKYILNENKKYKK
jgi:hypothetical protein